MIPGRWKQKIRFEQEAWNSGYVRVAGLDEVGRGPLAGPVVAACVTVQQQLFSGPPDFFDRIDDSKKLKAGHREELAALLHGDSRLEIGIGVVDQETIDRINILEASRLAMRQALSQLSHSPDFLLVDGTELPLERSRRIPQKALVGGDGLSLLIGAASIVAKVHRDRLMNTYEEQYPGYGFARHKGYGTAEHLEQLRVKGPCALHRKSFFPVRSYEEAALL